MSSDSDDTHQDELFRQYIGTVKPLNSNKLHLQKTRRPKPAPNSGSFDELNSRNEKIADVGLSDYLIYTRPGLQKNVVRRLKRGLFKMEATLDLHGMTSDQANSCLIRFLQQCFLKRLRCIHIIHGKGYRSLDQQPVLKNQINIGLREYSKVLAFCSSTQKDGGTGAVYVLLSTKPA